MSTDCQFHARTTSRGHSFTVLHGGDGEKAEFPMETTSLRKSPGVGEQLFSGKQECEAELHMCLGRRCWLPSSTPLHSLPDPLLQLKASFSHVYEGQPPPHHHLPKFIKLRLVVQVVPTRSPVTKCIKFKRQFIEHLLLFDWDLFARNPRPLT